MDKHTLIIGPYGAGKTTVARQLIADRYVVHVEPHRTPGAFVSAIRAALLSEPEAETILVEGFPQKNFCADWLQAWLAQQRHVSAYAFGKGRISYTVPKIIFTMLGDVSTLPRHIRESRRLNIISLPNTPPIE